MAYRSLISDNNSDNSLSGIPLLVHRGLSNNSTMTATDPQTAGAGEVVETKVDLKKLPSFSTLAAKVKKIESESSWWERHGMDWFHVAVACCLVPGALQMLRSPKPFDWLVATFLLGCFHSVLANKSGHLAPHYGLCRSPTLSKFLTNFFVEFIGSYSAEMGYDSHILVHHPHTNILGLGDSSIWKMPFLSRFPYLFLAPLLLPLATPIFGLLHLLEARKFSTVPKFMLVAGSGLFLHVYILTTVAGFSTAGAVAFLFTYRAVAAVSYIHVNVFQHIGLPMYAAAHRPARIYQMATGVLNLKSQWLLDRIFGHALVSCHVEHHLFPRLSDNMCLKVKPVVREYLQENGLPYQETSYWQRLAIFWKDYDRLMVHAPPITHFIGLQ